MVDNDPTLSGSTFREALAVHRTALDNLRSKFGTQFYTLKPRPTMTAESFHGEILATLTNPLVTLTIEEEDDDWWVAQVLLDPDLEDPLQVEYHHSYWHVNGDDGKSFAEAYCNYEETMERAIVSAKALSDKLRLAKG